MREKHDTLPFRVGQMAESRSFQKGYRGAWFRYKIKNIGWRGGQMGHSMEYVDFPDEKVTWTRLYQIPGRSKSTEIKRELMVRPAFPPVVRESQLTHLTTISEETLVVDNAWKVGDLVDWFANDCYWSGTVTDLLSDEMVKLQLPAEPIGEGGELCNVYCRDLRPSLTWSPEHGWSVPIPQDNANHRCCARLLKPSKPGRDVQISSHVSANLLPDIPPLSVENDRIKPSLDAPESDMDIDTENCGTGKTSCSDSVSSSRFREPLDNLAGRPTTRTEFAGRDVQISSHISANLLPDIPPLFVANDRIKPPLDAPDSNMDIDTENCGTGKTSCSDSVSSSRFREPLYNLAGRPTTPTDGIDGSCNAVSIPLNCEHSDSLEAPIMDLEELLNKVKWMKRILKFGVASNASRPAWKFLERRPSLK